MFFGPFLSLEDSKGGGFNSSGLRRLLVVTFGIIGLLYDESN